MNEFVGLVSSISNLLCFTSCMPLYPLRAKFSWENINIYLHFVSFLHSDTMQVVEILPQIRQEPTYSTMLCISQFGGPVLKASRRVQNTPFQLGDKSPKITDQHTAGGSVSPLSQLAKLSPWLTLSTKDITTSFWHSINDFVFYLIKSQVYIISLTQ